MRATEAGSKYWTSNKRVWIALTYKSVISSRTTGSFTDTILGYAHSIPTSDGGTHVDGMKAAVTDALNFLGRKSTILQEKDDFFLREHAWEHLTCVLALKVSNLEFEGQTKTGLGHLDVRRIVEQVVQEMLTEYLERHPNAPEAILSKSIQASRATMVSKKGRVLVRRKNILKFRMLPGTLSV